MKKLLPFLMPIIFLLLIVALVWYLFFIEDFIIDSEKRITGVITILGLGFGVFQFWIVEINSNNRRLSELKYNEYRQLFMQIESIPELLNKEMMNDAIDSHYLVSSLINQINRVVSLINTNNSYLFTRLADLEATKNLKKVLEKILGAADKCRFEIEKAHEKKSPQAIDLIQIFETIKWHNNTRDYLSELHSVKYAFYAKLIKYL